MEPTVHDEEVLRRGYSRPFTVDPWWVVKMIISFRGRKGRREREVEGCRTGERGSGGIVWVWVLTFNMGCHVDRLAV